MVHHYLESKTCTGQHLFFHADNAVGQNKNNTVLHYLAWRVLSGRNPVIKLSFMLPGHTKFAPDRFFGLIKKLYRHTPISTQADLEQVVKNSTTGCQNVPQCTFKNGERCVVWYDWSAYLSSFFRPLPGILQYHHFRFDATTPGIVFSKEYEHTAEVQYKLTLDNSANLALNQLPGTITPSGMSPERQRYLFEKIRPFCSAEGADITCPRPIIEQDSCSESTAPTVKKKQTTRLCSHCRKPGHTKTVRGKITCPDFL